jgi:chemotaxis signal transduction protein
VNDRRVSNKSGGPGAISSKPGHAPWPLEETPTDDDGSSFGSGFWSGEKKSTALNCATPAGCIRSRDVSYIPGAPDFILGIINMRGKILSVVDLKKIFDLADDASGNTEWSLFLKMRIWNSAWLIAEIIGVISIPRMRSPLHCRH